MYVYKLRLITYSKRVPEKIIFYHLDSGKQSSEIQCLMITKIKILFIKKINFNALNKIYYIPDVPLRGDETTGYLTEKMSLLRKIRTGCLK